MNKNSDAWKFGQACRDIAVRWFQERGYYVVPNDMIETGGAPMLEGHLKEFVLPDLQIAKDGQCVWVDVKGKAKANHYARQQLHQHGIELRHWIAYMAVCQITGLRGAIAILERDTRMLGFALIDVLQVHGQRWRNHTTKYNGHDMIFFPRDLFHPWHKVHADWPNPIPECTTHAWSKKQPSLKSQQMYLQW